MTTDLRGDNTEDGGTPGPASPPRAREGGSLPSAPTPVPPPPDAGEDVDVDGDPWAFDECEEISRRRIGERIVILYGLVVVVALVLVALGLDAGAALFVIGPFGLVVAAVIQHYFGRGRP